MKSLLLLPFALAQLAVYSSASPGYQIRNPAENLLEPVLGSSPPPCKVSTKPYRNDFIQTWWIQFIANTEYNIRHRKTGWLLAFNSTNVDAPVWVLPQNEEGNKFKVNWRLVPVADGYHEFYPDNTPNRCLGQSSDETLILVDGPAKCQKWSFHGVP
ncbi:hypothetical protein B0O80DRAFT_505321 [Mortierella sp. GBAus27b]|nr:hypothetical protein B0O80DRAFT_505321 [Mortierella sp. GBAus27b]